jgi:hypothetical protein
MNVRSLTGKKSRCFANWKKSEKLWSSRKRSGNWTLSKSCPESSNVLRILNGRYCYRRTRTYWSIPKSFLPRRKGCRRSCSA